MIEEKAKNKEPINEVIGSKDAKKKTEIFSNTVRPDSTPQKTTVGQILFAKPSDTFRRMCAFGNAPFHSPMTDDGLCRKLLLMMRCTSIMVYIFASFTYHIIMKSFCQYF